MENKKTSLFENGLIWFGAAVSIAEIITGTYFAPLGFEKGLLAIILGHIIGCLLMFLAGVIGGKTEKCAMDTVRISFGKIGALFFSVLNIIQLIGWTSIMIYDGGIAANGVLSVSSTLWMVLIGVLILVWILVGIKNLGKLNTISMTALFLLTIALSFVIFKQNKPSGVLFSETISFGAALELSIAMPLSWLPLISDYTKDARKPVKASLISSLIYGVISVWMYVIGMSMTLFTGAYDIAQIIIKTGFGVFGLLIIVLSTVTTTFLDAYSSGVSSSSVFKKINAKHFGIFTVVLGTVLAVLFKMENITNFLYFIGSVFAPMIAILITDFFILKNDASGKILSVKNIVIWFIGFLLYRYLMTVDIIIGSTLPDMIITSLICIIINKAKKETES